MDIDFEGNATQTQEEVANQNQEEMTHLDGKDNETPDDVNQTQSETVEQPENEEDSSTGELSEGDTLELDGVTYRVDNKGNIIDDKGSIFKEAKDVKDWLKSLDVEEDNTQNTDSNLALVQEALGVSITDAEGNEVEFTDNAEGIKSYVNSVLDLKSKELQEAAVNSLFAANPMLKQFNDYVKITGTAKGFGEIPDRTNIRIDKDNEAQQVAIIKMAAQEFGNKTLNDNYIKYLKDNGALYDEASAQLKSLQQKDYQVRQEIEQQAEAQRKEEAKSVQAYWDNVDKIVRSRVIAGHKIPETFVKEVDGKKITLTPNDFYNYLSRPIKDENGNTVTGYQRDLANLSNEDYLNKEMLDAWLMFTGGSYKDLVDMAVKEEQVRKLRLKSKEQRTNKTVKIIKKPRGKVDMNDIVL